MPDHAEIETLVPADAIRIVDGRLDVVGGWDTLVVPDIPRTVSVGIAGALRIPWDELEVEHTLVVSVTDPAGQDPAVPDRQSVRVGRPPGLEQGASAHVPFAITVELTLRRYGRYTVGARLHGREGSDRRVEFEVRATAEPPLSVEEENVFDEEMGLLP